MLAIFSMATTSARGWVRADKGQRTQGILPRGHGRYCSILPIFWRTLYSTTVVLSVLCRDILGWKK